MCMNILLPNGQISYFPAHHALVSRERVPLSLRSRAQSARRSGSDMLSSYTVPDHDSSYPTVNYWYREQLKTVREPHHQPSPPQTSHLIQQHRRRLAVQRWLGSGRSRQTLFRGKPLSPSVSKTRHGCARIPRATRAHPHSEAIPARNLLCPSLVQDARCSGTLRVSGNPVLPKRDVRSKIMAREPAWSPCAPSTSPNCAYESAA